MTITWDSLRIYDLLVTGQHALPLATSIDRYTDLLLFHRQYRLKRNTYKETAANETQKKQVSRAS